MGRIFRIYSHCLHSCIHSSLQILEINDNGIYSAVEVQERNDIKTGGIYQVCVNTTYTVHTLHRPDCKRSILHKIPPGYSSQFTPSCKHPLSADRQYTLVTY